jgi:anthranilate/para-aminobenzoate synthase component I
MTKIHAKLIRSISQPPASYISESCKHPSSSVVFEQQEKQSISWVFHDPIGSLEQVGDSKTSESPTLQEFFAWVDQASASLTELVPFCAGYLAYEAFDCLGITKRASSENKKTLASKDNKNLGSFVLYSKVIRVTADSAETYELRYENLPEWLTPFPSVCSSEEQNSSKHHEFDLKELHHQEFNPQIIEDLVTRYGNTNRQGHIAKCEQIKEMIRNGDVYQVNISLRLDLPWISTPATTLSLKEAFLKLSGAPRRAWIQFPSFDGHQRALVSASPELFFSRRGSQISCCPIKGTRPSFSSPEEDLQSQKSLLSSTKDKAELAMIVDLVRNDLNRVCEVGSVSVEHHFKLETYAAVHHTVSEISGLLNSQTSTLDLFYALFPSGSVTGAPKIAALEAISLLESHRRDSYCGAIGYFAGQNQCHFNVGIRTLSISAGIASVWAGSGITIDSNSNDEFDEALVKLVPTLRLMAQAC